MSRRASASKPAARRCAINTRVSTDHGLDQDFNSLDAQREACAAYVKSQIQEGWGLIGTRFDDGGFSGASLERPALQRLLEAIRQRRIDVIIIYKVDRLTRSLADFAKLIELFDAHSVSFISITQSFNTTTSMGRLTLNPVRTRGHRRAHPGQDRRLQEEGHLGRRGRTAGLQSRGSQARRRLG
jgi:site-specific DNA recombinase